MKPVVEGRFWQALLFALLVTAGLAVLVVLFWKWIALTALGLAAWKYLLRRSGLRGRRRPKASWAKLLESLSLVMVAWNTRGLVQKVPRRRDGFTLGIGRSLRRVRRG